MFQRIVAPRRTWWVLLILGCFCFPASAMEVMTPVPLPQIGPWLSTADGLPAHWLGVALKGRVLFEPMNVVIIDPFSETSDEAIDKFLGESTRNGFSERWGHSAGYWAKIGEEWFPQISTRDFCAIADGEAYQENNHGRVFGPYRDGDRWIFVAALSRENFNPFSRVPHGFRSFNLARDQFAHRLAQGAVYRIRGLALLGNLVDDEEQTSGDHDGTVVLEAIR